MITQHGIGIRWFLVVGGMAASMVALAWALGSGEAGAALPSSADAHVAAATPEEAGRYLVLAAGCNDCHTPGWMEVDGRGVPEETWLTGVPLGWKGPWGTTYARNLRLTAQNLDAAGWLARTRAGGLPPMPWANLRAMSDQDLVAIWSYLRALGPAGEVMPAPLAPGVTPTTPWLDMEPKVPTT